MAATATPPQTTPRPHPEPNRGPLEALGLPPAPPPRRRATTMVGAFFAIAAGTAFMGALLAGYLQAREVATIDGAPWVPEGTQLPNVPLILAYATLLMSSFTAQWAVSAIRIGARRHLYVAVGITLVLGLCFVNALSFSWGVLELPVGSSPFADAMYAVTVGHLVLVVAAHVLFVVMGFRALGGHFGPRNSEFVNAAAAFWHFTVLAGAAVWWSIWFLEGGPG